MNPTEERITGTHVILRLRCECGGECKFSGQSLESFPPQYPHVCERCGVPSVQFRVYPVFEIEGVKP
jgi:hypothetical protein